MNMTSLQELDVTLREISVNEIVAFRSNHRWTVRFIIDGEMLEARSTSIEKAFADLVKRVRVSNRLDNGE
jgi:hypothetical protein